MPRISSWDILSRPYGTVLGFLPTQDSRPGLLSAVPAGLFWEVLTQTLKPVVFTIV